MMYMHYCKCCHRIHMLNGHKMHCPRCDSKLTELKITYMEYIDLDLPSREVLRLLCSDEDKLKTMSTNYRLYKYSKWYKKLLALEAEKEQALAKAKAQDLPENNYPRITISAPVSA